MTETRLSELFPFTSFGLWFFVLHLFCLSVACGIYQNSMYGVAANLPMRFTNAIVLGNVSVQNFCFRPSKVLISDSYVVS